MYFQFPSMNYSPGTHIVASLHQVATPLLQHYAAVKALLDQQIQQHALQNLGEVYHDFPGGGFTAVICLSESHISLHSWPEHGLVNLDIYLSNFLRTNDGTVAALFNALAEYFGGTILHQQTIQR